MLKIIIYLVCMVASSFLLTYLPAFVGPMADIFVQLFAVIFYAVASYVFARVILPGNKDAWLHSVLCPLLLTIPYMIPNLGNEDVYKNAIFLFVWCEIWALIGCVSRTNKMRKQEMDIDDSETLRTAFPFYWLWMPIVHYAVFIVGYLHIYFGVVELYGKDWGSMVIMLCLIVMYGFVLTPLLTVAYCKRIHMMGIGWAKYLLCVYNAVIMSTYNVLCNVVLLDGRLDLRFLLASVFSINGIPVLITGLVSGLVTLIVCDIRAGLKKRKNTIENPTVAEEAL